MTALKNEKKVRIAGKSVEVRKLPLGKMAALFQSIQELPKELSNLDAMDNSEALRKLPYLIGVSIPAFAPLVSAAVEKQVSEEELLEQASLEEVMELVLVFCEVNNIAGIIEQVKKIKALTLPGAKKKN